MTTQSFITFAGPSNPSPLEQATTAAEYGVIVAISDWLGREGINWRDSRLEEMWEDMATQSWQVGAWPAHYFEETSNGCSVAWPYWAHATQQGLELQVPWGQEHVTQIFTWKAVAAFKAVFPYQSCRPDPEAAWVILRGLEKVV